MPLPTPASLRDRTPEFLAIAERLQRQPGFAPVAPTSNGAGPSSSVPGPAAGAGKGPNQHSEFARRAADIGHGIHRTSLKLQKLAQLAKRTSAFDDPAQEIDDLTGIIKEDIKALNNSVADLQRLSARSRPDNGNKQVADHSTTVVDNLRSRLKDATMQFRDVLTARTDTLKHHQERRQLFTSNTDPEAGLPLLARHRSSAAASNGPGSSVGAAAVAPMPSFLASSSNAAGPSQVTTQVLAPQDNYLSSRAEALHNVEKTIVELGGIFTKLSELVAEQGELAIRIDENVEDTLQNVNSAQAQLLKYLNSLQNNRWLVLKVLGVLLVFLVVFIMFIA